MKGHNSMLGNNFSGLSGRLKAVMVVYPDQNVSAEVVGF